MVKLSPIRHKFQKDNKISLKGGIKRWGTLNQPKSTCLSKWSNKMSYILGLFMADGCLTDAGSLHFSSIDNELIRIFQDYFGIVKSFKYIRENRKPLFRASIKRKRLTSRMNEFGIFPRKTGNEIFPNMPSKYQRDFIRGYFDGDGSVYITHCLDRGYKRVVLQVAIACANKNFLKIIQDSISKYNIYSYIKIHRPHFNIKYPSIRSVRTIYYLKISGKNDLKNFYYLIYYRKNIPFLKRKKDIFIKYFEEINDSL